MHGLIGGNTQATLLITKITGTDELGDPIIEVIEEDTLVGWLDLLDGNSDHRFNTKLRDSTHVFIADYKPLPNAFKEHSATMHVNGAEFDVRLIDDVMGLHEQYEIILKYVGEGLYV